MTDTRTAALKFTVAVLLITASVWPTANADQPATPPRIGVLDPSGSTAWAEGFRDGLSQAGYGVGRDIMVEWRRTAETEGELQSAASDLVRSRIGLMVTTGSFATRVALQNTSLPVVFLGGDPVAAGFASSLAKPGGRATGVSGVTLALTAKQLDLLHQLAPKARRVGFLTSLSNPLASRQLTDLQAAARTLGVRLEVFDAANTRELDVALRALEQNPPEVLLVSANVSYLSHTHAIVQAARNRRIPAVYGYREFVADGGLMSYGIDMKGIGRVMAGYVDKILKGTSPAELPIEQVSTYELIINLRAAHELGIRVPQEILFRADEVMR